MLSAKKLKSNKKFHQKNGVTFLCDKNLEYYEIIFLLKQYDALSLLSPYNYSIKTNYLYLINSYVQILIKNISNIVYIRYVFKNTVYKKGIFTKTETKKIKMIWTR